MMRLLRRQLRATDPPFRSWMLFYLQRDALRTYSVEHFEEAYVAEAADTAININEPIYGSPPFFEMPAGLDGSRLELDGLWIRAVLGYNIDRDCEMLHLDVAWTGAC